MKAIKFIRAISGGRRDALAAILETLKKSRAKYAFIGDFAVNAYAEPVVSLNMDIAVEPEGMEKLLAYAEKTGFKIKRFEHSVNLTLPDSDLRIQIQTDPRYFDFVGGAKAKNVLGYKMKVASVEDVLKGKIWAYMDSSRRASKRQKDLADIMRLVEKKPALKKLVPPEIIPLI